MKFRIFGLLFGILWLTTCGHNLNTQTSFILPYAEGSSFKLIQGNNGPWGHSGHAAYAFDFVMPIGSPVLAAQAGIVVAVEEQYVDNTRTPGEENFVIIQHADSSFGRYYHLTKNGAFVAVGDPIKQGQTIAISGNSGATAGAHLHFDVTTLCFEWGCQTRWISFINASTDTLIVGEFY